MWVLAVLILSRGVCPGNAEPPVPEIRSGIESRPIVHRFDYRSARFTPGSENARRGGWLTFEITGDPAHLNPLTSKDSYESDINQFIMGTLVTWDLDTDEPLPFLADGWLIEELPSGGQAFTFHLDPRSRFSDGQPVSAADVLFSFQAFFDEDYPTAHNRSYYSSVRSIRALDDRTVRFETTDTYYLNFQMIGTLIVLPGHIYEPYMISKYKQKKVNPVPNAALHPVGCGPYVFVEWIRGKRVLLKRDPDWWGDVLPHFRNCHNFEFLQIRIIKDSKIAFEHFKRGDIDFYAFTASQWVRETGSPVFQSGAIRKIEVRNKVPRGYNFIGWNLIDPDRSDLQAGVYVPHPLFGSAKVRQAMTHMIDRELYVRKYRYGYDMRCTSPFGNRSDYSDPDIEPLDFDPGSALDLLRQAGWDDHDRDTILDQTIEGGKRNFIFTLLIPSDSPSMEAMASIIREDLRSVGCIMNIKTVEWNSFQKLTDDKAFDAFTMGWTGMIHPDPRGIWHSRSAALGGNNLVTFIDPEVDRLSEEGVRTIDKAVRVKKFRQIHRILHREQPYTFLTEPQCDLIGVNRRINMMTSPVTGAPYFEYGIGAARYWWVRDSKSDTDAPFPP
ncbi:hypothetical protein JXA40_06680 [bacterium]|nr:hypothetical protein [candidate division CSSED10-310 bacterium]